MPAAAHAHGLYVFVSTPASPPHGLFLLILPAFLLTATAAGYLSLRRSFSAAVALLSSFAATATFWMVFLGIGEAAATMNTAPPPGLAIGHKVLWGLGWDSLGDLFLGWNAAGLALLVASHAVPAAIGKLRGLKAWSLALAAPMLAYLVWLVPYAATGAYAHGGAGGYVWRGCGHPFPILLCLYVDEHAGRLPRATTFDELVDVLLENEVIEAGDRDKLMRCRVARCFEREVRPYFWNARWAGCEAGDIPPDEIIFQCTYHPTHTQSTVRAKDLCPPRRAQGEPAAP